MALGDDFDPDTPNQPAALGLDDPIHDWRADNSVDPATLAQFSVDPERAKQDLADRGIPPPDHHYQNGQPVNPDTGQRAYSQLAWNAQGLPPIGEGGANQPPVPPSSLAANQPPTPPSAGGDTGFRTGSLLDQLIKGQLTPDIVKGRIQDTVSPQAGVPTPPTDQPPIEPKEPGGRNVPPGTTPLPTQRPIAAGPRPGQVAPDTGGGAPTDIRSEAQKRGEKEKEIKPGSPEALSNFAKSLQGIKAPKPPEPVKVSTPSVRGPVGIQAPQIANLLALIGAHAPAQGLSLMRLLGRA